MEKLPDFSSDPLRLDFFDLCRILETRQMAKPRVGDSLSRRDEYLHFGQDPFFAFPSANITAIEKSGNGVWRVLVRFLGLLGPQGALPLATTEEAFIYLRNNDDAMARFLDLFNNRFIQLFFRAWADGRAISHRDRGIQRDRFSEYLGSFLGIGINALRERDTVRDEAKIAFAGLLGTKARSASRLKAALASLFAADVEIEEFVGMRLMFDPEHRSSLGKREFGRLGKDMLLGAGVFTVQDKIRIRITTATLQQYSEFLPVGGRSRQLADFVRFYIGLELDWDVELGLPTSQAQPVRLGQSGQLGWTGWLSPQAPHGSDPIRRDARFDLNQRFRRQKKHGAENATARR
ncbi:MAG: type VI secretion system baseplate subunit TssG [Beijerinckiaceae bacterium]